MQSILTQCPRCQTSFKVSDKQLAIAEGMVRCGSCLDVFSAPANRITIKQPVSATQPVEDEYEDEETAEQPQDDEHASRPEAKGITGKPALATQPEFFELNYAVTLNYGVGQLPGSGTATGSVAAASPSSPASEHLDFVLDYDMDDIPLGDMELDDVDLDELEPDEFEAALHDELGATGDFADAENSADEARYEEYEEADEDDEYTDEPRDEEIAIESAHRHAKPDTAASYEDALIADDLDTTFDEEFPEAAETTAAPIVIELAAEVEPVPELEVETIPVDEANREIANTVAISAATEAEQYPREESISWTDEKPEPLITSTLQEEYFADGDAPDGEDLLARSIQDDEQHVFDVEDEDASPAEEPASTVESGLEFTGTNEANSLEVAESSIAGGSAGLHQETPINQEALYEAYAANIPEEAPAEEPLEIMAHSHNAWRDDNEGLDNADSFTAANFPDDDELQVPGFSALTIDEADEDVLSAPPPRRQSKQDKEELRQYLAELEDADALEALPATTMDTIEAEPLTLEVGRGFRKYISTFGWFCLSVGLLAAFVLQVVSNNIELIQKSPLYSRYLPVFCRVLECPEPEPVTAGIQSLYSQDLLVRSHPRIADALEVSFIFRNDAELPQPFPLVELSFMDSNKRLIANRLFEPEEYLPPELAALDLMPARSNVQVMLELADPGSEAVDYAIKFREATADNPASPTSVP